MTNKGKFQKINGFVTFWKRNANSHLKIFKNNSHKVNKNFWIYNILEKEYRKWGWFGTNFGFDARLRRCRVLYYTAIGGIFLILIWTSFSSFTVGTYFFITLLFYAKNLRFLGFRFCGWFGTTEFLGELRDFDGGFLTYYI
jgi:hypothetical protein